MDKKEVNKKVKKSIKKYEKTMKDRLNKVPFVSTLCTVAKALRFFKKSLKIIDYLPSVSANENSSPSVSTLIPCNLKMTRKMLGDFFFSSNSHNLANASVFRSLRMLFSTA